MMSWLTSGMLPRLVARELPLGAELVARDPLRNLETRILLTQPAHFDAEGARMRS